MKCRAFTLIELLVVITIIVVLLALLTPALDRAIYQAELAVCAARYKATATGGLQYAFASKRHYPTRGDAYYADPQTIRSRSGHRSPGGVSYSTTQSPEFDLRVQLEGYVTVDAFVDPLSPGPPIDLSDEANDSDTLLLSTGQVYFGWGYVDDYAGSVGPVKNAVASRRMKKVGDRFAFNDWTQTNSFSVLTSDRDALTSGPDWVAHTHPDDRGLLTEYFWQNADNDWGVQGAFQLTAAWWWNNASDPRRGRVDNNYGMDDGSVVRFTAVEIGDERLRKVSDGTAYDWYSAGHHAQLPAN